MFHSKTRTTLCQLILSHLQHLLYHRWKTAIFQKSSILYALHKAQRVIANAPNRRAIICEGQIDTIRCHAAGFETAVASQGTAFTEEHVRILKRYADSAVMVFEGAFEY